MARIEKTVFISYRRTDVYTALAVYENLKNQGYDVFFDYRSISSGDFEQIITSNIRARAHFLLILTPTALNRCNEPGDWLRREIEFAIDQKRNIIPLFFKGFRFGDPSVSEKLTGKLRNLSRYNGLNVHEDYFEEAMQRLRTQYLNIPLTTVLHPVSTEVLKVVREEQVAADKALEQIPDVKELVKQVEEKSDRQEVKPTPKRKAFASIVTAPFLHEHATEKPIHSTSFKFRLFGGIAGGLLIFGLLIWSTSKLLGHSPLSVPNTTRTPQADAMFASQPSTMITLQFTKTYTPTPTFISSSFSTSTNAISGGIATGSTTSCYGLQYIADVTIPDNTLFIPGQSLTKTWKVKNAGSCAWDAGFKLAFAGGDSMNGQSYILTSPVAAGTVIDISIAMVAPNKTGVFRGNWRMSTASGQFFGDDIYVQIVVGDSTSTPQAALAPRISDKDGMTLLYVPAGEFTMGSTAEDALAECQKWLPDCVLNGLKSSEPPHRVFLDSFWIDQTEVTNKMYSLCEEAGVCREPIKKSFYANSIYYGDSDFDNYPVIYVTWYMAKTYCQWTGRRLPTEAEWEKAARSTDERTYPWGNEIPNSNLVNAYGLNGAGEITSVGRYPAGASPYGALDMAGNVQEWVEDWYKDVYYTSAPHSNPFGPDSGRYRVVRGGAWAMNNQYDLIRSAYRWREDPGLNDYFTGFRCAMSATP